jgi:hypothetical protein
MPPDLPPELFTALVNRLAELVLADLQVEGDLSDELQSDKDESNQAANHQPNHRRRPCA